MRSDALAVGRSSGYLSVPAGERTVGVTDASGGTLTAVEATVDVVEGAYLTVLVLDAGAQTVDLYPLADGLGALPPPGRALARLVHAAPGTPALSGLLTDEPGGAAVDDPAQDLAAPSFAEVEVGSAGPYQVLPANRYHLRLQQQDGTVVLEREELALDAGAVYTLVAHGGVDGVTLTVLVDVITPSAGR